MQPVHWQGREYYTSYYFHAQYQAQKHIEGDGGKYTRHAAFLRRIRDIECYARLEGAGHIVVLRWRALKQGSSTPNRGAVKLSSKRGSRHTSRGTVSTHSQEERHGPHNGMLPPSALPCQRPNRPGPYWDPCAAGAALHLPRVSHNLQRPPRDRLLSAPPLGGDSGARRDLAG